MNGDDELKLWLSLFKAETEEEIAKIEALEVSVMQKAIGAYRHVAATDEFQEIERLRSRTRHNEASALRHARNKGMAEGETHCCPKKVGPYCCIAYRFKRKSRIAK